MPEQHDHSTKEQSCGVDPGGTVAPISCPVCRTLVRDTTVGVCPRCGEPIDRHKRLLDEYGPEIFIPGARPKVWDLSGPTLVIEVACVVALAALLLAVVYDLFGRWGIPAILLAAIYWVSYTLVRRRSSVAAAPDLIREFAHPLSESEPRP